MQRTRPAAQMFVSVRGLTPMECPKATQLLAGNSCRASAHRASFGRPVDGHSAQNEQKVHVTVQNTFTRDYCLCAYRNHLGTCPLNSTRLLSMRVSATISCLFYASAPQNSEITVYAVIRNHLGVAVSRSTAVLSPQAHRTTAEITVYAVHRNHLGVAVS